VNNWTIACENCKRAWKTNAAYSIYERQATESRPCPQCGLYTLRCEEPKGFGKLIKIRKRSAYPAIRRALAG
jgi:hypothetical protein